MNMPTHIRTKPSQVAEPARDTSRRLSPAALLMQRCSCSAATDHVERMRLGADADREHSRVQKREHQRQ